MASEQVRFILEATWKGQGAKQADAALKGLKDSTDALASAQKQMASTSALIAQKQREAAAEAQRLAEEQKKLNKEFQQLMGTVTKAGLVLAAAGAAAGGFIFSATKLAARVETLGVVVKQLGSLSGHSEKQMRAFEKSIIDQGITMQAARQALATMAQAQIDFAKGADLARIAQDTAVIANVNSSEAFERLVFVIQTGNIRMARQLGLLVDFQGAYEKMGKEVGVAANNLTAIQKVQARVGEVMAAGSRITGTYEAAMTTAGKQMLSLERHWEESRRILGEAFLPVLSDVVTGTTDMLRAWEELEPAQQRGISSAAGTAVAWIAMGGAATALIGKIGGLAGATSGLGIAIKSALGPLGIIIALAGVAATADAKWRGEIQFTQDAMAELDKQARTTSDSYKEYREELYRGAKEQKLNVISAKKAKKIYQDLVKQGFDPAIARAAVLKAAIIELTQMQFEWRGAMENATGELMMIEQAQIALSESTTNYTKAIGLTREELDEITESQAAARDELDKFQDSLSGGPSQIEAYLTSLALLDAGAGDVQAAFQKVKDAQLKGFIDTAAAAEFSKQLQTAAIAAQVVAGEMTRGEAISAVSEAAGVGWGTAAEMLDSVIENLDKIPEEVETALNVKVTAFIAGVTGDTQGFERPHHTRVNVPSEFSGFARGGLIRDIAGDRRSNVVAKVGEKGWEYIIDGVVIPHEESVKLARLGLGSDRQFANGGIVFDPGTGGGTSQKGSDPVGAPKSGTSGGPLTGTITSSGGTPQEMAIAQTQIITQAVAQQQQAIAQDTQQGVQAQINLQLSQQQRQNEALVREMKAISERIEFALAQLPIEFRDTYLGSVG